MSSHKTQHPRGSEHGAIAEKRNTRTPMTTADTSSAIPVPSRTTKSPSSFFSRHRQDRYVEQLHPTEQLARAERKEIGPTRLPRVSTSSSAGSGPDAGTTSNSTKASPPSQGRPRNVLRRKTPSVSQRRPSPRGELASAAPKVNVKPLIETREIRSLPGDYKDPFPYTIFGIAIPPPPSSSSSMWPQDSPTSAVPELASLAIKNPSRTTIPVASMSATASTPSPRYSDSPGLWSRTSTPTTMSSYSPGITQPTKIYPRTTLPFHGDRRPPVTWRKGHEKPDQAATDPNKGLHVLRESLTSSSLGSTVKVSEAAEEQSAVGKRHKQKKLAPSPPSPPPRKSSMKFTSPHKRETTPLAKTTSPTRRQPPPELAHLRTTILPESPHEAPPRPSRHGTGDLDIRPSPIIQSNLSPLMVSGHKRRESSESLQIDREARSSRFANPTKRLPEGHYREPTTDLLEIAASVPTYPFEAKQTSAVVPATHSKLGSRFGFFSKQSRATPKPPSDHETKGLRKGPAAGTGHEGYGKYAQRGRRTSIGSSSSRAQSTSTSGSGSQSLASFASSTASNDGSRLDQFLRERLQPVPISGGGGTDLARSDSNQSSGSSQPSISSTAFSIGPPEVFFHDSSEGHRTSVTSSLDAGLLASSARLQGATRTLADRRSLRRSQLFNGEGKLRRPTPTNTRLLASPASLNSYETSQSSFLHTDTTLPTDEDVLAKAESRGSTKGEKADKKSKWNFFQRSRKSDRKAPVPEPEVEAVTEMPVTISRVPALRPVAHYAIMESEYEQSDNLEDILQAMEGSPPEKVNVEVNDAIPLTLRRQHGQSVLLPSPPDMTRFAETNRPDSPKVQLYRGVDSPSYSPVPQHRHGLAGTPIQDNAPKRSSRLAQVGRIPPVISKRDRQHQPASSSFSRPFTRAQDIALEPPITTGYHHLDDNIRPENTVEDRPTVKDQTDFTSSRPFAHPMSTNPPNSTSADIKRAIDPFASDNAFLSFPPRHGSEVSGSSSSGVLTYAPNPFPDTVPTSFQAEDEVWNEYDDLIDHVLSPTTPKTAASATSSLGLPFRYVGKPEKERQANPDSTVMEPDVTSHVSMISPIIESLAIPTLNKSHVPAALSVRSSASVRLRRSRILSALHSSIAPSSPMSVSELLARYAEGAEDTTDTINRGSSDLMPRPSPRSSRLDLPSAAMSNSQEMNRQRLSVLMDIAERDRDGPIAASNLRFGALMTSRWLSFGRVLFSPAHTELRQNYQDRILVIDGLGNDDWSFYCAETYPTATVYSLSQVAPPPSLRQRTHHSVLQSPPNHRTIHHPSISAPFPFPKGFFTAAVFRFPAVASEAALRNVICECMRVLRPGGYLELSVLDLDLLNMGTKTRRAVRNLKVRISVADSSASLKPTGDNVQRMLGRRGFENLNRCMVSLPVAGKIGTSEPSTHSRSSLDADVHRNETGVSLNEMLHDPSPEGDAGITKMVSRVGRWWFTRCYEWGVLPNDDLGRSIWTDKAVMKECERMETGFRLLIAYAQKPAEIVRRTVSV